MEQTILTNFNDAQTDLLDIHTIHYLTITWVLIITASKLDENWNGISVMCKTFANNSW